MKMLLSADGSVRGTIGGGCGEGGCAQRGHDAVRLRSGGAARLFSVAMDADVDAEEGMACGGVMDVFLERLV